MLKPAAAEQASGATLADVRAAPDRFTAFTIPESVGGDGRVVNHDAVAETAPGIGPRCGPIGA